MFFILAFTLIAISGCDMEIDVIPTSGQRPSDPPMISHFDSANLECILIPVGRSFLYRDSASGIIDSVIVTTSLIYLAQQFDLYGYPQTQSDILNLSLSTVLNDNPGRLWYSGSVICDLNTNTNEVLIDSIFSLSNNQTGIPVFWYPFTSSYNNQYTFIPALELEGNSYTNVHRFEATNGLPASDINYLTTIFYWVKGIGIIKRETHNANAVKTEFLVKYW